MGVLIFILIVSGLFCIGLDEKRDGLAALGVWLIILGLGCAIGSVD